MEEILNVQHKTLIVLLLLLCMIYMLYKSKQSYDLQKLMVKKINESYEYYIQAQRFLISDYVEGHLSITKDPNFLRQKNDGDSLREIENPLEILCFFDINEVTISEREKVYARDN